MERITKHLPWIVGALALAGAAVALTPPRAVRGFDVDAFSQLPVLEGGRVKPIDSVARNSLLMIRSQQSFRHEDRTVGPQEWLLDVMFRPEVADRQPIFVINDPEVLGLMGLQQSSNRYFSFATIMPHIEEIQRQAEQAHQVEAQQRTRFQNAIANLFERLYLYYRLKNTLQLAGSPGLAPELAMAASPGVAQRLTGASMCQGQPLKTYMLAKVHASPPCGAPMPLGGMMLSADEIACLTTYLAGIGADGGP